MIRLNLPECELQLRQTEKGLVQVFDVLRRKFVALTPEEWVRQHFTRFLIQNRKYPAAYMANEVGINHNGCSRRCDTIVYDRSASPLAIVEYKAPDVEVTARVFDQIVRYNMVLGVKYLIVSNGLKHYCCVVADSAYRFLHDIPTYEELL